MQVANQVCRGITALEVVGRLVAVMGAHKVHVQAVQEDGELSGLI